MPINHHEVKLDHSQITDQIYLGTDACCQNHFSKRLLEEGITAAVSLEAEKAENPLGFEFFSWIPVIDQQSPTLDQYKMGVEIIDMLIKMGKKIYVYCKAGQGRSPSMLAAYFVSKGATVKEAIAKISEKRQIIHLQEEQIVGLERFANTVKKA